MRDVGSARIAVIGLGYVGLPLARCFSAKGFPVLGFDTDPEKVERLLPSHLAHTGLNHYLVHLTDAQAAAARGVAAADRLGPLAPMSPLNACALT